MNKSFLIGFVLGLIAGGWLGWFRAILWVNKKLERFRLGR